MARDPLLAAALALYGAALVGHLAAWQRAQLARFATLALAAAVLVNGALVASVWIAAGRPPVRSLYESLLLFALCVSAVTFVMERVYGTHAFGALAALAGLCALAVALTRWDAEIVDLPPALQSGWFVPHVVAYFLAYGALFFAAVAGVVRLLAPARAADVDLDAVLRDALRAGFTLLTIGLFIGAAWARSAWGDYWIWDRKESWALVTWLAYAGALHLVVGARAGGRRAAWVAIGCFAIVLFTYLGVAALPGGAEHAHVVP